LKTDVDVSRSPPGLGTVHEAVCHESVSLGLAAGCRHAVGWVSQPVAGKWAQRSQSPATGWFATLRASARGAGQSVAVIVDVLLPGLA